MAIVDYIAVHWVQWLFAVVSGALALGYKTIATRLKEEQQKNDAIARGVQCLLRDSIVSSYNRYSDKGYMPIYAKESLKSAFKAYSKLGGNDVAEQLYQKMLHMPEGEEHENDKRSV